MSTCIHAVDLECQSFWMENFWSPESVDWFKLRTFFCERKLILSTNGDLCFQSPSLGWPAQIQLLIIQPLAIPLVICGLIVTLPSSLHRVKDEFELQQFTCVYQLYPRVCRCPLACPCQCQPPGKPCLGPFGDRCFRHPWSSCNGNQPGTCGPFHSSGTIRSCPPFPHHGTNGTDGTDLSNVSCT